MHLMSTSMLFCSNGLLYRNGKFGNECRFWEAFGVCDFSPKTRRIRVPSLARSARGGGRKRPWWERLFSDEVDELMISWKAEDVLGNDGVADEVSADEKFESWKRKAEVIIELREAQEDARNEEAREWEDWLGDDSVDAADFSWDKDLGGKGLEAGDGISSDPDDIIREKGFSGALRNLITGKDDNELLFEDRVFEFASTSSVYKSVLFIFPILFALFIPSKMCS